MMCRWKLARVAAQVRLTSDGSKLQIVPGAHPASVTLKPALQALEGTSKMRSLVANEEGRGSRRGGVALLSESELPERRQRYAVHEILPGSRPVSARAWQPMGYKIASRAPFMDAKWGPDFLAINPPMSVYAWARNPNNPPMLTQVKWYADDKTYWFLLAHGAPSNTMESVLGDLCTTIGPARDDVYWQVYAVLSCSPKTKATCLRDAGAFLQAFRSGRFAWKHVANTPGGELVVINHKPYTIPANISGEACSRLGSLVGGSDRWDGATWFTNPQSNPNEFFVDFSDEDG